MAEDQGKIDGLKEEVRDKTARVNELEVGQKTLSLKYMQTAKYPDQ